MDIVITVHGVNSAGEWQREVDPELTGIDDLRHYAHVYPFPALDVLSEQDRLDAVFAFFETYSYVREQHPGIAPSIIAHSFGTYLVARALAHFPFLELDRLVLCGSVIDREYDWTSRRVNFVVNEIAGADDVVALFRNDWLCRRIPETGSSGLDGFIRSQRNLREIPYPEYRHSDFFISNEHCRERWIPVIRATEEFRGLCHRCLHGPDASDARREFDNRFGPEIGHWVQLCFPADRSHRDAMAKLIRAAVIQQGVRGHHRPDRLIAQEAMNLYRVLHDSNWSDG